jgi:hypothetical protein
MAPDDPGDLRENRDIERRAPGTSLSVSVPSRGASGTKRKPAAKPGAIPTGRDCPGKEASLRR